MPDNIPIQPIKVEFNAFIPQDKVTAPIVGTFSGDNRSVGEAGTHRTQHTINVASDPTRDPPYRVTIERHVGETHKLDAQGNVVKTATAPVSELDPGKWRVEKDGTIVVDIDGNGKNPLVPGPRALVPGITYDMQLRLKPNSDGTWAVAAKGSHDGFPGYEAIATVGGGARSVVHGYDPREHGRTPNSLFPIATDIDVDVTKTVGAKGVVSSKGGASYSVNTSPYGDLSAQTALALADNPMSVEDKLKLGPQLVKLAGEQRLQTIDSVVETSGGSLTAMSVNPANAEDVRRVTLNKQAALEKAPDEILREVAAADVARVSPAEQVEQKRVMS